MEDKKYKIFVPTGNPDDGFEKRKVKARLVHHPHENDITLMGFRDKRIGKRYAIVELTTGFIVAEGKDKLSALVDLGTHYHSVETYKRLIKDKVDKHGTFNKPIMHHILVIDELTPMTKELFAEFAELNKLFQKHLEDRAKKDKIAVTGKPCSDELAEELFQQLRRDFKGKSKPSDTTTSIS